MASYNGISWAQAFTAEFVGTFILVFTIFGVIHRKAAAGFAGLAIGLVVFAAIIPVAPATGASINPARTFGPMLVQQIAGGTVKWEQLPVYLLAELLAGVAAAALAYGLHRPHAGRPRRLGAGIDLADPGAGRPHSRPRPEPRPTTPERRHVMKKLINDPNDVVVEALLGIEAAHPDLQVDHQQQDHLPGRRAKARQGRRSSPAAARATSRCTAASSASGMLDAACAGEVFTSPVPDQMLAATKLVDGGAGVLHVVKNYTGDVMNFEMAAEMAAAETRRPGRVGGHRRRRRRPGQHLDRGPSRRRGHGAAGEDRRRRRRAGPRPRQVAGDRPEGQRQRARAWAWPSRPARCRRPASPRSSWARTRWSSASASTASPAANACRWPRAKEIAEMLVEPILADLPFTTGDPVIAFVNGLGGTPLIELYVMYQRGGPRSSPRTVCTVARSLVGPYITSLDMAGASVTLLKVDDELLSLWDAPVNTPALRWGT